MKFTIVAFGAAASAGHARRNPEPDGAGVVTDTSTATAASGTPQPPAAPPWADNPEPATWNVLVAPAATGEPARVSTTRHGVTGTNTEPDGEDGTKYPCTSTITCVAAPTAATDRSAVPPAADRPIAPVLVVPRPVLKLMNAALGGATSAGHARRNPEPDGAGVVTDTSTATAASGTSQPPAAPPWADNPEPATWNVRVAPAATGEPARVSTTRHGVTGTNT